ncbi:AAA family ATPase [Escherichia coli]
MLKRIKSIEGVGNYIRAHSRSYEFNNINVIYGENRHGKSTLCDIFYSLSTNSPELVVNRKTILEGEGDVTPKIELQFTEGDLNKVVKFNVDKWLELPPPDSKLYIFDQSFVHRNVMAGTISNRENSECVTAFILGEDNVAAFEALEKENSELRSLRGELRNKKSLIQSHQITNVDEYAISEPVITDLDFIESKINGVTELIQEIEKKKASIKYIKARPLLDLVNCTPKLKDISIRVNKCLSSGMAKIHDDALSILERHKEKVKAHEHFNGWASNGLSMVSEICPFCGQNISGESKELINAYKDSFDESFIRFIESMKKEIKEIRRSNLSFVSLDVIDGIHGDNISVLSQYLEEEIKKELDNKGLLASCSSIYEQARNDILKFNQELLEAQQSLERIYDEKELAVYNEMKEFDFSALLQFENEIYGELESYNSIIQQLNDELVKYKESVNATALDALMDSHYKDLRELEANKKRLSLEPACREYLDLKREIEVRENNYKENKKALEECQEEFLNKYFEHINSLFCSVGSSKFAINKKINRQGAKIVYELDVSFNGKSVEKNKLNCLFSESDRRALALCIFLSKIYLLSEDEKSKAILIMDDPVTSFDEERISCILQRLYELQPNVKQMFITTHYKGMAAKTSKKFNLDRILQIKQGSNGSNFEPLQVEQLIASDHEKCYERIVGFIDGVDTDKTIIQSLRPYLEAEFRSRYRKQLAERNLNDRTDFSVCISRLADDGILDAATARRIHGFRTELNEPMHVIREWTDEDMRSYARDMLQLIYTEL